MSDWPFKPLEFSQKIDEQVLEGARDFYADVQNRRTVLDYSDQPVSKEVIENALLAAGTAPSGANRQPWYIVAV